MKYNNQSGAIFIYILLAVALLAALTYAVSNSSRTNVSLVTDQQAKLAVQEAMNQAGTITKAFQKLTLRGFSETEISFENSTVSGYALSDCDTGSCKIFDLNGGAVNWLKPPQNMNSGEDWVYTGNLPIFGNGNQDAYDITMILPNINEQACRQINFALGITSSVSDAIPTADDTSLVANKLATANPIDNSANYIDGTNIDGKLSLCLQLVGSSGVFSAIPANAYFYVYTIYAG